ncbi:MAG: hypothetical protein AB1595_02075, partial [bacterium]
HRYTYSFCFSERLGNPLVFASRLSSKDKIAFSHSSAAVCPLPSALCPLSLLRTCAHTFPPNA